jgi:glycerophosphoryl diester phosphodiesterase
MKLIAHRGWSQGASENTLAAFARAAADPRVAGVEFDVRRDASSDVLLVTHDVPHGDASTLTLDAALAFLAKTDLELFIEAKQPGIAEALMAALIAAGMAERSVVFAFTDVAQSLPWTKRRRVRLGAILLYPWTMHRFIAAHDPDVILLGWDERRWTRAAFRTWWSAFSLARLSRRYGKPVVAGIVRRPDDLDWLETQHVYAAVADMDVIAEVNAWPKRQFRPHG